MPRVRGRPRRQRIGGTTLPARVIADIRKCAATADALGIVVNAYFEKSPLGDLAHMGSATGQPEWVSDTGEDRPPTAA